VRQSNAYSRFLKNHGMGMAGVDLFSYELVEAMQHQGCIMCRVVEVAELRYMATFVREGWQDPGASRRFLLGGGFCRHHAWLFHQIAKNARTGVSIAHLYGRLLEEDLAVSDEMERRLARGPMRNLTAKLHRSVPCLACVQMEGSLQRSQTFLVEALTTSRVAALFEKSDGLCWRHFVPTFEEAISTNKDVAELLLRDWRHRLRRVAHDLAEYDRKRDYRYAAERTPADQRSWAEAIRRYVGEPQTVDSSDGSEERNQR
jgi:hypothetical protein